MVDHATAKYLNESVGDVLAKALADMAVTQPTDGVDFLANWLKTYADQQEANEWRLQEEAQFEEERAKMTSNKETKERKRELVLAETKRKEDEYLALLATLNDPETNFQEDLWTRVVEMAKQVTESTSGYLGLNDEEGIEGSEGNPCIRYDWASMGADAMLEKFLPKETGVTWQALTENPPDEAIVAARQWKPPPDPNAPPPPAEGEEPPEGVKPAWPYLPVYIPDVMDVPEMHFFDMTRLGAYLAVPMVYPSYYTADSLADAKAYLEQMRAEAAERARLEEERAAAAAAAVENGEEPAAEAAPLPEVEEKPMVLRGTDVKMLMCMDTLPLNTRIPEAKILDIMELCKAAGACKARTETKQVREQATTMINEELKAKLEQEIEQARNEGQALQDECDQKDSQEEEESGKNRVQKQYAYLRARQVALKMQAAILELRSWVVVSQDVVDTLAATALMYGYKKTQVYPRRKATIKWEFLKMILDDTLFVAFEKTENIAGVRKDLAPEHKLAFVKSKLPADMDEAKAKEISPAFEVLFSLIKAAIEYRRADLDDRKAMYEKRKAAAAEAEEGAEPFNEEPIETTDDDFVE